MRKTAIRLPADFGEALGDLLKVKPPPKPKAQAVKKRKGGKKR